jgi:hypothetical protein
VAQIAIVFFVVEVASLSLNSSSVVPDFSSVESLPAQPMTVLSSASLVSFSPSKFESSLAVALVLASSPRLLTGAPVSLKQHLSATPVVALVLCHHLCLVLVLCLCLLWRLGLVCSFPRSLSTQTLYE